MGGLRTSDEPSFVGGQPASACSAPANIPSQEKDEYRRAQLRREARWTVNTFSDKNNKVSKMI